MNPILNELQRITCDLQSDKSTVRNKAVEQLDQKLNSSKDALNTVLSRNPEFNWQNIFCAVKDSIFKHAANLNDANARNFISLSNKCYIYGNVLDKIVDYNLEVGRGHSGHFLTKSALFQAFESGIKQFIVVKHFGDHFINLLTRGIYLSSTYVAQLKVSEYSCILSYLFELNVSNDEYLLSKILKCITQTLQLARQHVQLAADLIEYLPALCRYIETAGNAGIKVELVRLYEIFVTELSVNYHYSLCVHMQEILPKLCDFYNEDIFREDTNNVFFNSVTMSLRTMYPNVNIREDTNNVSFNSVTMLLRTMYRNMNKDEIVTSQACLTKTWQSTLLKLRTIVNMEIRKNNLGRSKPAMLTTDKFSKDFIKMAALVVYIVQWNEETTHTSTYHETPHKRIRLDTLESVIKLIDKQNNNFSAIWFAIFAELLQFHGVLTLGNYQEALQITIDVLNIFGNSKNLRNVRFCLTSILAKDQELLNSKCISRNSMADEWTKLAKQLLSVVRPDADEIIEKQIIFRALIKYNKLSHAMCIALLQAITTSEVLRRNECLETVRYIFIHAEQCGLDKASVDLEPIIKWAYAIEKSNTTQMIYNIAAIDPKLLADTIAISIINFLDEEQSQELGDWQSDRSTMTDNMLQLMLYKYNKKLLCLDQNVRTQLQCSGDPKNDGTTGSKNCLFQENYELLMRLLNPSTSSDHDSNAILRDLQCLLKLVCIAERLLYYKVLNASNLAQCPLFKRIGLFLSNIEFQYKANQTQLIRIDISDLRDIVEKQISVLEVFHSNDILLQYMENQPLEMLVEFIGVLLQQLSTNKDTMDSTDSTSVQEYCFRILGCLCANNSYSKEAFRLISANINSRTSPNTLLCVMEMLCKCKELSQECLLWLTDALKEFFYLHHTNADFISRIVDQIPTIIKFTFEHQDELDDMLSAIISMMRIALKKSYPTFLSVKIILSIGLIAQRCENIYEFDNFKAISYSVSKFLIMQTLEVRFSAIETLMQLLNAKYCVRSKDDDAVSMYISHMTFCEEVYKTIEWKKLSFVNEDMEQNNHSVAVQLYIALFAFSTYHQEMAVRDLLSYSAQYNLNESHFAALENIVDGKKQTMRELLIPYAEYMLHIWFSNHWPVDELPHFLCYANKNEFLSVYANLIMAFTFIYGKEEDINRYRKIINENDALSILKAYLAPKLSACMESTNADFQKHHDNLFANLQKFNLEPMSVPLNATTICTAIKFLNDKEELNRLFSDTLPNICDPQWFNLSTKSLFATISKFVIGKKWSKTVRIQSMSVLMFQEPLILVHVLSALKTDCYQAILTSYMLQSFFRYCTIADAILDAAKELETSEKRDNTLMEIHCSYFVRDIWIFVCRFILYSKCVQLHRAALEFIGIMLVKCSFKNDKHTDHMNEIASLLIKCVQHVEAKDLKLMVIQKLEAYFHMYKDQLKVESLLNEIGDCKQLQWLSNEFERLLPKVNTISIYDYIHAFLKPHRLERLTGLREYIAEHKEELQKHDELLFELTSQLILMVRESPKRGSDMTALKCLAELGPLKMKHSYYFLNDFAPIEQCAEQPMDEFINVIMETLERQIFTFNINTQAAMIEVVSYVANCKSSANLIDRFPNLRIFHTNVDKKSFLNSVSTIPPIDWLSVLKATDHLDYEPWLRKFMGSLFSACQWQGFDGLASQSFDFASTCMQSFIKLLMYNSKVHLDGLCSMLEYFFTCFAKGSGNIYQDKRVINRFLYICECVRFVNNWDIPINLGNVVKASNHCQSYFLSIMYLELWGCSTSPSVLFDKDFQESAKTAYRSIGCVDAIPGFLNPMESRFDYLSLNDNLWDILLESDNMDVTNNQMCMEILKGNGMLSFANVYQRACEDMKLDYDIFWRLGSWDEEVERYQKVNWSNNLDHEFNKHHYVALKSICKREQESSETAINNAYQCVQEIFRNISVESLQTVYKYLTWLCMLQQTEDFCQIQFRQQLSETEINEIFGKRQTELNITYGSFNCKEQILSHQIALFKISGTRASRRIQQYYNQNPVDTYLLKSIGECKAAGRLNLACKYISTLRSLPDINESTKISVLLEDADANIKKGNHQIAKAILEHVNKNKEFQFCLQRVPALRMHGEFLLNCNAESLEYTLENKFNQSLKLLDHFKMHQPLLMDKYPQIFEWDKFDQFENKNRMAAHEAIAKFADREYQRLHDYRQSQEYQMIIDITKQNRQLAGTVAGERNDRDRQIGAINLNRFAKLDEQELRRIDDNLTEHLCTAIYHYIVYCQLDKGSSSAAIYRIIALWFTNDQNKTMLDKIAEPIQAVPSYKFICAINQLTGRLNSKNEDFHKILVDLLVRCGTDHPQQTFYKLYPLIYAYLDGNHSNTQRADIARTIIKKCTKNNPTALQASRQFEDMFPALITFANNYLSFAPNGRAIAKGLAEKFKKLSSLKMDSIQCPTVELPVNPSGTYNIVSMIKWTGEFVLCGGLNAPLKVQCLCSDGVTRTQLIKGRDDLRQDAVMQQVFGVVNELLRGDSQFIERRLQLRTYKVTPLSNRSGIIEWCNNTMPVGTYLVGDGTGGAHMKYHPKDWNNRKCRELMAAGLKKSAADRLKIYKSICEHVQPVFHHFLLEKFPIPGEWFERRLAYINSVATTSIVGYVLGLGDRHTHNILIDEQTAEVVHIDFGIAFEQGKIQTTPETVPFRLTRDFVAPMGICGTNGVFTKSCEATMHILRRYKSVLTTILEVLLYDPLFIWGVLANKSQDQSDQESKNLLAQRALLLVKYKLEGREPGSLENSDVEAQVQRLINEATLPSNLALLYHGWDPYL